MKTLFDRLGVLYLGFASLASFSVPGDIHAQEMSLTGNWEFTVESPNGTGNRQVALVQEGDSLSGTITSSRASGPVTGWVHADTVTILAELTMDSGPFTVVYEATLRDGTLTGIVDFGDYGAGTFTGRKVEAPWADSRSVHSPAAHDQGVQVIANHERVAQPAVQVELYEGAGPGLS
jgi:hypothetical protein